MVLRDVGWVAVWDVAWAWKVTGSPTLRVVAPSSKFLEGPPSMLGSFLLFFLLNFFVCPFGKECRLLCSCLGLSGNCELCVAWICARVGRSETPSEGTTPKGMIAVHAKSRRLARQQHSSMESS